MKKLILLGMLGFASAIAITANAQVSINVSIGSQPRWAPVYEDVAYRPVVTRYYEPEPRYVEVRRYAPVRHYYNPAPRHYYAPRQEVRYVKYDKHRGHGKGGKHGHGRR